MCCSKLKTTSRTVRTGVYTFILLPGCKAEGAAGGGCPQCLRYVSKLNQNKRWFIVPWVILAQAWRSDGLEAHRDYPISESDPGHGFDFVNYRASCFNILILLFLSIPTYPRLSLVTHLSTSIPDRRNIIVHSLLYSYYR